MNRVMAARMGLFDRISGWTLATIAFAVSVAVLLACYWQTAYSLGHVWAHDGTYQYAFLIFPVVVWLVFDQRDRLHANRPVPSIWGLAGVLVLVAVWYAGRLLDVNLLQHFAFVAMFPALVLSFWGWRALWTLIFPLVYLVVFAVPWGNGLVGPLQDITARIAVHTLELTGTPVLLNGREIVTPSAVWMVAEACSGVKFFIACTALGCLYSYLMYRKWWKRVLFVILAAIVPIIANGLRVYFTVLIGDTWGLHYATGTDHMIFGWQFFGTVLVLLLVVGWFFRDPLGLRERPTPDTERPSAARTTVWPAVLAVLIAGPVAATTVAASIPGHAIHLAAPALPGWSGPEAGLDGWHPSFSGAAGVVRGTYRSDGGAAVGLYHAVYTGKPRRGHTLITFGNDVYDPAESRILATATQRVQLAGGATLAARELRLAGEGDPKFVWYWYCIGDHCSTSAVDAKLLQAWYVLRGKDPRSSVWALSTPIANGDDARARAALREFVRAVPVDSILPAGDADQAGTGTKAP